MNNFSFRRLSALQWQIRHDESGAIVTFTEGRYDDTMTTDCKDAALVASITEVAHEDFQPITECNDEEARADLIDLLTVETLTEAATKLGGMIGTDEADEYAFEEDLLPMLAPASPEIEDLIHHLTNDEMIELICLCALNHHAPHSDVEKWLEELRQWSMDVKKHIIRQQIGSRITELRTKQGMTQEQLADKAHVTVSNIRSIEAGRYAVNIDVLHRISSALGTDIELVED